MFSPRSTEERSLVPLTRLGREKRAALGMTRPSFFGNLQGEWLSPVGAVERAVLDGFAEMFGQEGFSALEVGYGARDFQDAVVGAGGEATALDGGSEELFAIGGDGAVFADELGRHLRIGVEFFFAAVALDLNSAGAQDAVTHACGAFDVSVAAQLFVFHGGDCDVDVNTVEQRAGNFRDVTLNLYRRAMTFAGAVSEKSAGTWIHRGREHEARGKFTESAARAMVTLPSSNDRPCTDLEA